jgi:hypothetical protein
MPPETIQSCPQPTTANLGTVLDGREASRYHFPLALRPGIPLPLGAIADKLKVEVIGPKVVIPSGVAAKLERLRQLENELTERRREKKDPLDARAVAVFFEHRDWTKKSIARHLRCHEKSLCRKRCPKLAAAIEASKDGNLPRGSKDGEGNLEAWEGN